MTPDSYRASLAGLGLSQVGAARLFGVDPRTSRRWAAGDLEIPKAVQIALKLMLIVGAKKLAKLGILHPPDAGGIRQ